MEEAITIEPLPRQNEPDLYMLNASIKQYDEKGSLQHTLNANRFTHFPLTNLTAMETPTMSLAAGPKDNPWIITANQGRILPSSNYRYEIVELWNNVLAIKSGAEGKFLNIQTQSLTVYPDRDYAETDEKVFIDNQTARTSAAGMKAFFDSGKFMFFSTDTVRVTTVFLADPK